MQASSVTISPETLRFNKMSPGKKAKLRRKNIIELIKSKPVGTPIRLREFAAVTLTKAENCQRVLRQMVKEGVLSSEKLGPHKSSPVAYFVNNARITRTTATDRSAPPPTEPAFSPRYTRTVSDYAKDYYWETHDDSLHGFVAWMDKIELQLRRGGGDE